MSTVIKDGSSGSTVQVDEKNRMRTFATTQGEETTAALEGDTYTATTSRITLTSDLESAVLYVKNTDDVSWILTRIFSNVGASTAGTGDWNFKIVKNPTAGTLISAGTVVTPQNLNFGSAKELTSTILEGVEASTITNGTDVIDSLIPTASTRVLIANNPLIIEPASTMAIKITPPSGNTSFTTQTGFVVVRSTE